MKKTAAMIAVFALCSAPAFAANQGGFTSHGATQQSGGFTGPNGSKATVESVKSLRDDATGLRCGGTSLSVSPTIPIYSKMPPAPSMWISTVNAGMV